MRFNSFSLIQIPLGLTPYSRWQWGVNNQGYKLEVSGTGALTFNGSQIVSIEEKSFSVYIQTDKSIYKPGQKGE